MGWEFDGVDKWNFVDHVNENDALAGKFEAYGDIVPLKPYIEHDNRFGTWDLGANHGMGSFITTGNDSYPALTAEVGEYRPNQVLTHMLRGSVLKLYVELGTSRNDSIKKGLDTIAPIRAYGGDGADKIYTSSRADYLIGGRGDDVLDGSYGDDNYLYYKGDGLDFIYDISGDDILYLYGFSESDTISAVENPDSEFIVISCNGQAIAKISKNNREYSGLLSGDSFKVKVTINGNQETINITELFNTHKAGYRLIVGCPVSVEVLDPNGNVVHTLTDGEVGTWYTEYGNFYVFEEENGEYGKVLDLVEGYTARIVGADEGTMDVTYQVPVDGELTEPVSVSGVPVTEDLTATIEETEDGDVYLVIDEDSDGEADSERKLYGECPFTDVPEGSFYYEPVMWAIENGITTGITSTTFAPEDECTRGHVVTFLWRAAGSPEPKSTEHPFTDLTNTKAFYYKAVLWAVENGITKGMTDTTFAPDATCTRGQVVTFLWRAKNMPEPTSTTHPFTDVKEGKFYYKAMLWAVENKITNGMTATTFAPDSICKRGQVVTFLYRAYK